MVVRKIAKPAAITAPKKKAAPNKSVKKAAPTKPKKRQKKTAPQKSQKKAAPRMKKNKEPVGIQQLFRKPQGHLFDKSLEEERQARASAPVECLGMTFPNDDARREYFLNKLEEKLKDPEFRKIQGFPIGDDEDILRLSDPPYYTACPNPFAVRLGELSRTAPESADAPVVLPYTADIREGRGHPIYQAHNYHTKVPHQAIMKFILHYTQPGDLVLDGFCGTGMTGVAAQLCGEPEQAFAAAVERDFREQGLSAPRWGRRSCVLWDISPAATFIAGQYNTPRDGHEFKAETAAILQDIRTRFAWMFETRHLDGRPAIINYVIWSDVFTCGACSKEIVYWEVAFDLDEGTVRDTFDCPHCKANLTKRTLEAVFETRMDDRLGSLTRQVKTVPVLINYNIGGSAERYTKAPDRFDLDVIKQIQALKVSDWYPAQRMPEGDEARRNDDAGYTHVHHFYTKRILAILAAFRGYGVRNWLPFSALTPRATRMHRVAASRLGGPKKGEGGATVGIIAGTLYVPSVQVEMNILLQAEDRIEAVLKTFYERSNVIVGTGSCEQIPCPDNSVDYIFTDPPFGANFMYSELNFIWESWLGVFTRNDREAVVSKTQQKDIVEYQRLMHRCFGEYHRLLKPGRWMTVEFSNTSAAVWNAIQVALEMAGFVVANVSMLDKKQGSFKAVTTATAVKQDLIISCYKPDTALGQSVDSAGHAEAQDVWRFIANHLGHLPKFVERDGKRQAIFERQAPMLFDRMVAFYVQRGMAVPLSASEFHQGLAQRFPERDGMYFLPEQVAEYDRKRMVVTEVAQLELFVSDELSAIKWLREELKTKPSTLQELTPKYMREAQRAWAKHENPLELKELLEQNFICCEGDGEVPSQVHAYLSSNFKELRNLEKNDSALRQKAKGRWYVPDPNKAEDLEKMRARALLREFAEYREGTQRKLKVFRTEAVRAGFKDAYDRRDYKTIVEVAAKLPDTVLHEDEKLLMYYDVATTRLGE